MDAYQIGQGIQFLSHQGRLLPPSCYLSIEKIKEEAKWHESQREPQVCQIFRIRKAVAHRGEDRHDYGTIVSMDKTNRSAVVAHPQKPGNELAICDHKSKVTWAHRSTQ
jgi:hypothetical protein